MYRLHNLKKRTVVDIEGERGLLDAGFSAEEIVGMLCGLPVRGFLVRAVSELRLVDPMTLGEISDLTGISVPTISATVHRALKRMKRSGRLREFLHDVHSSRERMRGRTRVVVEIDGYSREEK